MDQRLTGRRPETAAHVRLKRLTLLWAQVHGYSACAFEVGLPKCRYRADVAAYRPEAKTFGSTAIFECKQALPDLRRDNRSSLTTRRELENIGRRRMVLEKCLRVHYPNLRVTDSLFPEFCSHDFPTIQHRGYTRVLRQLNALQNKLCNCVKFEKLIRYRCANLFYLVLSNELRSENEIPTGWGALIESDGELSLVRKPVWHDIPSENQLRLLRRIAAAGTRILNKQFEITFDELIATPHRARC